MTGGNRARYDALGQELKVNQRIFYMNSSRGETGTFGTITEILDTRIKYKIDNIEYEIFKTGQIDDRFIVLDEIFNNLPELSI
jgi:hypothetical protein